MLAKILTPVFGFSMRTHSCSISGEMELVSSIIEVNEARSFLT